MTELLPLRFHLNMERVVHWHRKKKRTFVFLFVSSYILDIRARVVATELRLLCCLRPLPTCRYRQERVILHAVICCVLTFFFSVIRCFVHRILLAKYDVVDSGKAINDRPHAGIVFGNRGESSFFDEHDLEMLCVGD